MDKLIEGFPAQISDAIEIGSGFLAKNKKTGIKNIVISGLGGSGIGGTIVSDYCHSRVHVPIVVNKTYDLPGFVNQETMVVICSYSGNTEETVSAFREALRRSARVAAISSGGRVQELAQEHDTDFIQIPAGMPPRACLGYSLVQILFILSQYDIIDTAFIEELRNIASVLQSEAVSIRSEAEELGKKLAGRIPVIYAESGIQGVAIRWRQQLNENSKLLCWHHEIPEMNHNELVGWAGGNDGFAVVILRTDYENERSSLRITINKAIIAKHTDHLFEVSAKGGSYLGQVLYLIHLGDWVSWYLAGIQGVDAMEIDVINYLKDELAKQ